MKKKIAVLLGITLFIVICLAPIASSFPDGLERVAHDLNFIEFEQGPRYQIMPDYTILGVEHNQLSTILAGIVGVFMTMGFMMGFMHILEQRQNRARQRRL